MINFKTPNFKEIPIKLQKIVDQNNQEIKTLLNIDKKNYNNFALPYQVLNENISQYITPLFHLDSVCNSKFTQNTYNECLPILSKYNTEINQNEDLFLSFKNIDLSSLSNSQKKVIENELKSFKLGGCGLNEKNKSKLKKLNLKIDELGQQFSQNLLNATNDFELICDDFEDVKEIPKSDLDVASFIDEKDKKVKWKFSLQMPSYISYITYGTSRTKREKIYKAYCTRAPQNELIISQILKCKFEKANILGFKNYAQYSLSTKMAKNEHDVVSFLEDLASKGLQKSFTELDEIKNYASSLGFKEELQSYDLAYYSEKLKEKEYQINEEEYKPYFSSTKVLHGLFELLYKLFNIKFKEVNLKTWNEKVKTFEIFENEKKVALIYFDLEARNEKKGGAWMNNWHTRFKQNDTVNIPSAFVVCNFSKSTKQLPSLLRHNEVVTLFHEMGHAIHHLLSKVDEPFVSGVNGVAWDVVEFPSQFLEYFSYDKNVLKMFAKHYKTNKIISDDMIEKLIKAKNFQSSLALLRQVEFALFDFKLHQNIHDSKQAQIILDNIRKKFSAIKTPKYNKFQNGFAHIFAGGYAAGYYSYKWAEVLSADAFILFMESEIFNKELCSKYKNLILSTGGSIDMNELYFRFASRKPKVESLLKIDGIA